MTRRAPMSAILLGAVLLAAGCIVPALPDSHSSSPVPQSQTTPTTTRAGPHTTTLTPPWYAGDTKPPSISTSGAAPQTTHLQPPPGSTSLSPLALVLPRSYCCSAGVWTGDKAILFGGISQNSGSAYDRIMTFEPSADTATLRPERLPYEGIGISAVWIGDFAYIFAGWESSDKVTRYDPTNGTFHTQTSKVPAGRYGTTATNGTHAYVLSGWDGAQTLYEYDPATESLRSFDVAHKDLGPNAVVASVAGRVLVTGGDGGDGRVWELDPETGDWTTWEQLLPSSTWGAGVFSDDRYVWIVGGIHDDPLPYTVDCRILRLDIETRDVEVLDITLPRATAHTYAFHDGTYAYVLGGAGEHATYSDEILRIGLDELRS